MMHLINSIISIILGIVLLAFNIADKTPVCLGGLPCLFGITFIWAGIMNFFFWKYGYNKHDNE